MTVKDFFSFRKNRFFWVNILLMIILVVLLVYGTFYGLDKYTRHGQSVQVPGVKGLSVKEAQSIFKQQGLKAEVSDSNYVKQLTPGSILEQNPAEGMRVKKGRIIYLTINTLNVPLQTVPDVADNSSLRQAQAKLLAAGFKLTAEEYILGERDWVYGVKYNRRELEPGEKVPIGATLTLLVGRGMTDTREVLEYEKVIVAEESAPEPVVDDSWF